MKAGTATKLALNTISTTLMVQTGRVYENLMVDVRATNDKLRDRAARIVSTPSVAPGAQSLRPRTTALTFCTSSHASIAFSAFCPRPPMPIR